MLNDIRPQQIVSTPYPIQAQLSNQYPHDLPINDPPASNLVELPHLFQVPSISFPDTEIQQTSINVPSQLSQPETSQESSSPQYIIGHPINPDQPKINLNFQESSPLISHCSTPLTISEFFCYTHNELNDYGTDPIDEIHTFHYKREYSASYSSDSSSTTNISKENDFLQDIKQYSKNPLIVPTDNSQPILIKQETKSENFFAPP